MWRCTAQGLGNAILPWPMEDAADFGTICFDASLRNGVAQEVVFGVEKTQCLGRAVQLSLIESFKD